MEIKFLAQLFARTSLFNLSKRSLHCKFAFVDLPMFRSGNPPQLALGWDQAQQRNQRIFDSIQDLEDQIQQSFIEQQRFQGIKVPV
jgi:hypothetical protein